MREEKKSLIKDVTARIKALPPEKQDNVLWYIKGIVDGEECRKKEGGDHEPVL